MQEYSKLYIDGKWQDPVGKGTIDVLSASTEEVIGRVPEGTPEDVDNAVAAARRTFDQGWGDTEPKERADWLQKLVGALGSRSQQLAETIAKEVGTPLNMSTMIQAGLPVMVTNSYVELARNLQLEQEIGNSLIVKEPIGVVGAITPWNYPLHQIMAKVAPAIAAGCTVVLKPSEVAPLNAFILAEGCMEIDLPAGVLNIVTGYGPVVGEAIAAHPDVDMVSLTGSVRSGKRVAELASQSVKKVTLELGGKSACVILDDANIEEAVPRAVQNSMLNSGQTCSAWTRLVVPRDKQDQVVEIAAKTLERMTVGDPLEPTTRLGPLVSETQRKRVLEYIEKGKSEGARLVVGGGKPAGQDKGYFVEPTIFADVDSKMTIAQEEIFGPVLSILPYDNDDDALRIANDTQYGLAGGVFSGDKERAVRFARKMRTGQIDINGGSFNPMAPFGGYKLSGLGRELGPVGLEEYFVVKALQR